MTKSVMHFAAVRANRTRLAQKGETFTNAVAKAAVVEALAHYDAQLSDAPARRVRSSVPCDRHEAARRANRTRLAARVATFTNPVAKKALEDALAAQTA